MDTHECDGCGITEDGETIVPPPGWVRRGGRRTDGAGRWLLVLGDDCESSAGVQAGADDRSGSTS